MTNIAPAQYQQRYNALSTIAKRLEECIATLLKDIPRIDRVSARAKTPYAFKEKALRRTDDNRPRYGDPLAQIQDQIGVRVIVLYEIDVRKVAKVLGRYFRAVEQRSLVPESPRAFGYFGSHWIFAVPADVIPPDLDTQHVPRFFELQVKTLFQHAWSEASHDLEYKSPQDLSEEQQRLFAFAAAQAWGADRVFTELWQDLAGSKPTA